MKHLITLLLLLCAGTSFAQSRPRDLRETRITVSNTIDNGPGSLRYLQYQTDSIRKNYMPRSESGSSVGLKASVVADSIRLDSVCSVIMPRVAVNAALASLRAVNTRDSITLDSVRRLYTPRVEYNTTTVSIRSAVSRDSTTLDSVRRLYTPRIEYNTTTVSLRGAITRDSTTIDSVRRLYTPRNEYNATTVSLRGNIVRDSILIDTLQKRIAKEEAVSATHLLATTAASLYQPKGMYLSLSEAAAAISAAVQLYVSNDSIGISGGNKVKLPKGYVPLTGTLTQTATIALTAGERDVVVPVVGILSTDTRAFPSTVTPMPAGYKIVGIKSVANGSITLTITAPLLALGASYSIPIQITVFR